MLYNVSITYDNGKTVNEITHSSTPFTINPKQDGITSCKVIVHKYEIEHHLPPTIFISPTNNKKYLIPMWIEVHPDTTYDDVKWIKPKQKKVIEHIEGSMGKYKTTYDPNKKTYKCTCMGFWRSKGNCKHVKSLRENNK
jgi:hypothetical protein